MPEIPDTFIVDHSHIISNLLRDYGEDTLSYFHLQSDRHYFFSPSGKAFLSYRIFGKVALVAGDPVGTDSEILQLIHSFLDYLKTWGYAPCFLGISAKYIKEFKQIKLIINKIGEEAVVDLSNFDRKKLKKKVRRAVRHVENLGIDIAFFNPIQLPSSMLMQMEEISKEWIVYKGRQERGFSMTLGRIPHFQDRDCQVAVALSGDRVVGYLSFVPVYKRNGLSLDFMRRRGDAPNGLNEFLIIKSAEYYRNHYIQSLSLNFAAFTDTEQLPIDFKRRVKRYVFRFLGVIYSCQALRNFNEKFLPSWENRYIAYSGSLPIPLYMLAIQRAER